MPKLPRESSQRRVVRAFIRAGGVEVPVQGKGSHRVVLMPNGEKINLPHLIKPGLLADMIKQSGLTLEEFLEHW